MVFLLGAAPHSLGGVPSQTKLAASVPVFITRPQDPGPRVGWKLPIVGAFWRSKKTFIFGRSGSRATLPRDRMGDPGVVRGNCWAWFMGMDLRPLGDAENVLGQLLIRNVVVRSGGRYI